VVDQLRQFGETRRGWLGVRIQPVTDEIAESLGMDTAKGALVAGIIKGGPVDNGTIHHQATLPGIERPRAYHLVPAQASKARAVAAHMRARGYAREEVIAAGDSREDMGAALAVGTFWLVRNAVERDPSLTEDIARHDNVRVAEASHGAGVYEAVVTTLAERR